MSREPDDPKNPNRPRPPRLERQPGAESEIKKIVDNFNQTVFPFIKKGVDIPNTMREFLAYAFLAETGHRARECCLVSKPGPSGEMRWWYEYRYPEEPSAKKHMIALEAEIEFLKGELRKFMEGTDA